MIGRGDGDGVDIFVLEQLADVDVGFGPGQAALLDFAEAKVRNAFIDVAEGGDFGPWDTREAADVIVAAAAHSANGHPDTIICADDFRVAGCGGAQSGACNS